MNRYFFSVNRLIIFILTFAVSNFSYAGNTNFISVETLVKENKVSVNIIGKGGHSEECIDFLIESKTKDTLFVLVEPGRRLVSDDSTLQDILILKKYEIELPPFASVNISVYGFCCQSSNSSPAPKSLFRIGLMAPKNWVKLAEFIDRNNFKSGAVQNAVWVLSDNHPVSSIYAKAKDSEYRLKKFVAELKGEELPWYSLTYKRDTARLFSGKPEKIFGKINYHLKHNTVLSVIIKNEYNETITTLIKEVAKGPGDYIYYVDMSVLSWPKGKYTIYFIEDYSNINLKKNFSL